MGDCPFLENRRMRRPRFTVRRAMFAVAVVALFLSVPEWLDSQQRRDLSDNAHEWGRYFEDMSRKARNPTARQAYIESQTAKEYWAWSLPTSLCSGRRF